jgi:hypothetical protein
MTFQEAIEKRLQRIRKSFWNEWAWLEIMWVDQDHHGPWGLLVDPCSQLPPIGNGEPDKILLLGGNIEGDWEESTEPRRRSDFVMAGYKYPCLEEWSGVLRPT